MGETLECEGLTYKKYNVDVQLKTFAPADGDIFAYAHV